MKSWTQMTKKELLSLPCRDWGKEGVYDSLLIVNTRKKHDSGYNLFAVIGCKDGVCPTEIAAYMDDFWARQEFPVFHIDASMSGVFRLHSADWGKSKFVVGASLSSTYIWTIKKDKGESK